MGADLGKNTQAFIDGLARCSCSAKVDNGVVKFSVPAVVGSHIGDQIETGVGVDDLAGWPIAPPHWVHFPDWVQIGKTNARSSQQEGWLMHSRNIVGWGTAEEPAQEWLAHVQSVLGGVVA